MTEPAGAASPPRSAPAMRRERWAWAMYDWASSAYSTLSITVLVFYLGSVFPGTRGNLIWAFGISGTGAIVAILSPVLGALADARATKRRWLLGATVLGAGCSAFMIFATPDRPWLLAALFIFAQIGIELSQGFYNAFLPEIADDDNMGRVSAHGYALGYVGGGLALLVVLLLFRYGDALGLPKVAFFRERLGLCIMGLWWGLFSIPTFLLLKERAQPRHPGATMGLAARHAFTQVKTTITHIRAYRVLTLFLIGFLFYNDGIQTVISQSSVFADRALGMKPDELVLMVLMIQFVALPGAWFIGWLADRAGQKRALILCLSVWIGLLIAALFVNTVREFWIMGAVLALVMGGTQSVSRAIMGLMTPPQRTAEFFGFFNFSGKAFSVIGPAAFGGILAYADSAHWALSSLLIFFIIGGAFILPLDIKKGQQQARG